MLELGEGGPVLQEEVDNAPHISFSLQVLNADL